MDVDQIQNDEAGHDPRDPDHQERDEVERFADGVQICRLHRVRAHALHARQGCEQLLQLVCLHTAPRHQQGVVLRRRAEDLFITLGAHQHHTAHEALKDACDRCRIRVHGVVIQRDAVACLQSADLGYLTADPDALRLCRQFLPGFEVQSGNKGLQLRQIGTHHIIDTELAVDRVLLAIRLNGNGAGAGTLQRAARCCVFCLRAVRGEKHGVIVQENAIIQRFDRSHDTVSHGKTRHKQRTAAGHTDDRDRDAL